METMRVKCPACDTVVQHQCHGGEPMDGSVEEAVIRLLTWVPEQRGFCSEELNTALLKSGRETGWLRHDDNPFEDPFFGSQSWSYPMFDKEEARTFHALIHNVIRAAGLDPNEIGKQASKIVAGKKAEVAEATARQARSAARRTAAKERTNVS